MKLPLCYKLNFKSVKYSRKLKPFTLYNKISLSWVFHQGLGIVDATSIKLVII